MPWVCADSAFLPDWFIAHWRRLALKAAQPDPFCAGPDWNLAYHHIFNPFRRVYYSASGDGALFFGLAGSSGRELFLPLEDSWLYGQPLLGPDAPELFARALPELLESCTPASPQFILSGMIEGTMRARDLCKLLPRGWALYRYGRNRQCSASLAGGVEGWLERRSANGRRTLRRSAKKAAAYGIEFERIRPEPGEVDAAYERMLAIESRSWKGLNCCGMTESPSREFYHEMLKMLAPAGNALIIFAKIADEDAGFIFGGLIGPYYRGQQFSYAQSLSELSLGNLMQLEKIRWLCELGVARYDMGPATGPRMEYKFHWTENNQEFQTWIMRRES